MVFQTSNRNLHRLGIFWRRAVGRPARVDGGDGESALSGVQVEVVADLGQGVHGAGKDLEVRLRDHAPHGEKVKKCRIHEIPLVIVLRLVKC